MDGLIIIASMRSWYKISDTFLFLFSNKMLVSRAGIHKKVVRIANSADPDQTIRVCTVCLVF